MCYTKDTKGKGNAKMKKPAIKMSSEELQAYLQFKRHGFRVPAKKGKGSYDRKTFKKACG